MDRPHSYSFERWLTSMMGGMKKLGGAKLKYQNSKASRDDCARILQPKSSESKFCQTFAHFKPRGPPLTNAILGSDTYL